jgi:hypothetical protein
MSKPPKGNPNPHYVPPGSARLTKMEKGKPTTGVTITPLDLDAADAADGEHWMDVNHAAYDRINAALKAHGIESPFKPSDIASRTLELRMFDALLKIMEKGK